MHLIRCDSIEQLRDLALAYLIEREAEHGLLVGLLLGASTLRDTALAAVVVDGDHARAVAIRLDSRMIVSRVENSKALDLLATAVADDDATNMVAGSPETVEAIRARAQRAVTFTMAQRVYAIQAMQPRERMPDAHRRRAELRDRETLIDGHLELHASLGASESRDGAGVAMDRLIASGNLFVWETARGDVVCTAGTAGPTTNGIRLNYVYTPSEQRSHGYASALVGDLTQSLLDGGRSFVFLHADVANPTACRLYERLGFKRVADFTMIRF
ncbi:MAG TPA: GNAT family N-acetyltransferase [Gemmatimonadaceae bacterium]|jgi:predicted GNAT family acetyltransferase